MKQTGFKHMKNTDQTNKRLIEISIDNPDLGARRLLPLLRREGIRLSESSVYRVLRRNGLNTRARRLARQEQKQQHPVPATEPVAAPEDPAPSVDRPVITPPAKPGIPPDIHRALISAEGQSSDRPRQKIVTRQPRRRQVGKSSLFLNIVNAALILLAVFIGYRNVENYKTAIYFYCGGLDLHPR